MKLSYNNYYAMPYSVDYPAKRDPARTVLSDLQGPSNVRATIQSEFYSKYPNMVGNPHARQVSVEEAEALFYVVTGTVWKDRLKVGEWQ